MPTTPYIPQQNRIAKQYFCTLFARTRAMLYDAGLTNNQWGEVISIAVYLKNRSPTKSLKEITSYRSDIGNKPDLSNLRKIGCVVYYYNKDPKRTKLSNQGIKCVFLDYKGHNQYRL